MEKWKILVIGILGIYSLYFVGSLIQERIMKLTYLNISTGEQQTFQNSNSFVLVPSLISWAIGYLYNNYLNPSPIKFQAPFYYWIESSALVLVGTLAMTKAIYLTSFPLVTLFKSCNLLSVISVGIFCSRVKDSTQKLGHKKLLVGLLVTIGVLFYHFGSQQKKQQITGTYSGISLLLFSLICDGLIPDSQAKIKTQYKPNSMQMFEHMNKWKSILSLTYSIITLQIKYIVVFFISHPKCFIHVLILSLTGAAGQMFVYWLIVHFRQHVVPFIITTRKIITVIISILYFKHNVTIIQLFGIFIVFITVFFDFKQEIQGEKKQIKNEESSVPLGYRKIQQAQSLLIFSEDSLEEGGLLQISVEKLKQQD